MVRRSDGDRYCFGPEARLRNRRQFLAVQGAGVRRFTHHFILYVRPRDAATGPARIGITASRKVGNAIVRNRWKRLVREVFRHLRAELPSLDVVVICRAGRDIPDLDAVRRELFGGLRGALSGKRGDGGKGNDGSRKRRPGGRSR